MFRLPALAALVMLMGLGACNTTAGLGRDVQDTGEFITEGAQETADAL